MVEAPSTSEVTNFDQIDQSLFKEFLEETTVWDFDNIWDFDSDLTISKANFSELTFCYINQGQVSLVKGGEQALYLEYTVCGQIMLIANPDPSINQDTHNFEENQVLIYVSVYNKSTGLHGGLEKMLGHITLRGDQGERYYSYGYSKEKSSVFYCSVKDPLPNIFHCTAFKKHHVLLLNENKKKCLFLNCFSISPLLWIEKRNFCNGKITFIYIQLM